MHELAAPLLEMVKGIALSMAIVAAGTLMLKLLSAILKEVEKTERRFG